MDFEKQPLTNIHPRPEWQLGFGAMRRIEIVQYARQYRHKIGWKDEFEVLSKDALVKMMDGYMAQGTIPHPYQPAEHPAVVEARNATAQVAILTKQVQELLAKVNAPSDKTDNDRKDGEWTPNNEKSPDEMGWTELQKHAKAIGLAIHGKKRPEIIEALKAMEP